MVELYLHSLKYPHGVMLKQLNEWIPLPFYEYIYTALYPTRQNSLQSLFILRIVRSTYIHKYTRVNCGALNFKAGGTCGICYALYV
jgi:hypothetical protein